MRELYLTNENGENIPVDMQELCERVINFDACLDNNGRFKIRGTKYFWYREIDGNPSRLYMTAYGGYELGGRGCFYVELDGDC